jgi:CheY-like chemotaxis protein
MSKRILILDDDKSVLEMMKEALIYYNYQVDTEEYVPDIFAAIEKHNPDIVLIDYILNGSINGGEFCHQLKTNPSTANLPVVLITAYTKVLFSLGTYGCDALLTKPFNLSDLLSVVEKYLPVDINHYE